MHVNARGVMFQYDLMMGFEDDTMCELNQTIRICCNPIGEI